MNRSGPRAAEDLILKFLEHFAAITVALDELGLWDETDGLYYDRLKTPTGSTEPVKVRSMVGIIPALAAAVITEDDSQRALAFGKRFAGFLDRHDLSRPTGSATLACCAGEPGQRRIC